MRILEINKFYNPKRGADKHFLDVITLLRSNGHEVADFSMQQNDNFYSEWSKYFLSRAGYLNSFSVWEKIKGVTRMFYSFEAKRKINRILNDFRPDIVHIHNIYHQMSPAILFEIKKRKIPIVMTVHDFKIINPNHSLRLNGKPYRRCANGKYYQCFLDKCVKNSYAKSFLASLEMYWHDKLGTYRKNIDYYIVPSKFVKKVLVKWGMQEEKMIILPHFNPRSTEKKGKRYSFTVSDSYALAPGKISKEKGSNTLIEIFKNIDGMKLYLAGEIEEDFEILDHPNIVYMGFVGADQLSEYIRNSKCVVSGSELPETFGLIALEAISQGKPFVGFNGGAYSEIIEHGVHGFIADTKEEFTDYVRQVAEGKRFDEHEIKSYARKFDAQKYAENLTKIFSDVIKKYLN